jgi:protoporphyrinogen oxidase
MKSLYILGAGPAGLGAAYAASKLGEFDQIIVVDANAHVGGLAQTVIWDEVGMHDLGPHKLFTLDEDLLKEIIAFLPPQSWLTRKKIAKVFQSGRVMEYPPSIIDMVLHFNIRLPMVVIQFLLAKANPRSKSNNLQEALINMVGKSLALEIILPAVRKVWGDPLTLDASLAKSRIQIPTIKEILANMLKQNKVQNKFEALSFKYPKGGLSVLWESVKVECERNGVTFQFSSSISAIEMNSNTVEKIDMVSGVSFQLRDNDLVVNTINQDRFLSLANMPLNLPKSTMDLVLVFLHVEKKLDSVSWYFVADDKLRSHRMSSQSSFDPSMVPIGDVICLEFMDHAGKLSNEYVLGIAEGEFRSVYGKEIQIIARKVIRLKDSYPKFANIDLVTNAKHSQFLDSITNLLSIGRHGAGQYVGSLDAFDMGAKVGIWLQRPSSDSKNKYRESTSTYPILD